MGVEGVSWGVFGFGCVGVAWRRGVSVRGDFVSVALRQDRQNSKKNPAQKSESFESFVKVLKVS